MNGFTLYPHLISTTGAVSLSRTEAKSPQFAVLLDAVAGEILDTFTNRAEAEEFYATARDRVRAGDPWPDPDARAVADVCPEFIVEWTQKYVRDEEARETARLSLLPCGCYPGACCCGQYPTQAEMAAMEAEADALRPIPEPMAQKEMDAAEEVRNFWGRRADA